MKKFLTKNILFILILLLFFMLININSVRAEDSFSNENDSIVVVSNTYNKSFIDAYLDAEQSPFDGFKKMIDRFNEEYPNTLLFTSEDLPEYVVLIENIKSNSDGSLYSEYYFQFTDSIFYMDKSFEDSNGLTAKMPKKESESSFSYNEFVCYLNDSGLTFKTDCINSVFKGGSSDFSTFYLFDSWNVDSSGVIASNFDIYNTDNLLVFQLPTLRKATTLAPVIQKEKTKGTLQEVLMEIILILPLILVVVVSLVGLRKALKMLSKVLHRS